MQTKKSQIRVYLFAFLNNNMLINIGWISPDHKREDSIYKFSTSVVNHAKFRKKISKSLLWGSFGLLNTCLRYQVSLL